ncbi:AAA family ATPase [Chitinophagaceae bacterium 26-R-25]|nr:AAA family ATPase [Chitinophagaceae bacterium 26-R-25]
MKFRDIKISNWKQFETIEIDFHSNLTILTGANGSGKTTILNLLAQHFDWHVHQLATPAMDEATGFFKFFPRQFTSQMTITSNQIGSISYSNNTSVALQITGNGDTWAHYQIPIIKPAGLRGLNVPSHRQIFNYQQIPNIGTQKISRLQAFQNSNNSRFNKLYSEGSNKNLNYYIKETLINWAIGGSGNEFIQPDGELRNNFINFENILKKILPKPLEFHGISIRNFEIVLVTGTGDFLIDAVSGGISSIIDLGWSIFTRTENDSDTIVVLIDEIENHLHPSMQRSILPSLVEAFPNVQFIVSTHSPLVIGSVRDSNVFAFRHNKNKKVYNEKLDLINRAKSANEVLNEVLGVPFTMPLWVETSLTSIIDKYTYTDINPDIFKKMREELKDLGLENLMPLAMEKTIESIDDKNK